MITISGIIEPLCSALLTYAVHSTLLLGAAWLAHGLLGDTRVASREGAWRLALLGALLSAGIQLGFAVEPLAGRIELPGAWRSPAATPASSPVGPTGRDDVETPWTPPLASLRVAARPEPTAARQQSLTAAGLLAMAWLALTTFFLVRLAGGHLRLCRLLRDRRPVAGRLRHRLDELAAATGVRGSVALSLSPRLPVPLALGLARPEICLPSAILDALDAAEQDAVLAHELAHLVRRDPQWLVIARVLESLFFFQPLHRVARRRLQDLSELRADDWASLALGDSLGLASCLTTVAGWQLADRPVAAATPLAAHRSQLRRRIERLLVKGDPMQPRPSSPWITAAGLVLVACATVAAPSVSTTQTPPPPPPVEEAAPAPPTAPSHPSPATAPAPARPSTPARTLQLPPPPPPAPPVSPPGTAAPAPAPAPRDTGSWEAHEKTLRELDAALERELATLEVSMAEMEAMLEESLAPLQRELETQLQAIDEELESSLEPVLREIERSLENAAAGQQGAAIDEERAQRVHEIVSELSSKLQEQIETILGGRGVMHEELAAAIQATVHGPDPQALREIAQRLECARQTAELGEEERAALHEELRRLAQESRPTREEMQALRQRLETLKPTEEELQVLRSAMAQSARAARERLRDELEAQEELTPDGP